MEKPPNLATNPGRRLVPGAVVAVALQALHLGSLKGTQNGGKNEGKRNKIHSLFTWMSRWKLGSMVRINGLFHLPLNGVYWGYILLTNLLLSSWDIQVLPQRN